MQDLTEQLANLEQDGKQYAHFLTHPRTPGYYAVWVREQTPQYVQLWLQQTNGWPPEDWQPRVKG